MIKKVLVVASLLVLACSGMVFAQKIDDSFGDPQENLVFCPLDGYKSFIQTLSPPVLVPDNNPAGGPTIGPIVTPADGSTITDVIVDFRMQHTFVGDLIASVTWDDDCTPSTPALGPVNILCRQNRTGGCSTVQGSPFGCGADLLAANVLEFSDAGSAEAGEPLCTTSIAGGCYLPDNDGAALPFSIFDGRPKSGCWYLRVADYAGGDTGSVQEWSVHIQNSTTATEQASWGSVKGLYR